MEYFLTFSHKFFTNANSVFHFEKHETTLNSGVFFFVETQCLTWHDDHFFVNNPQSAESSGLQCDDLFFFFLRTPTSPRKYWVWGLHRNDLFFEITNVFFEISVVKRWPSQSLSYGIFTKTLGHFRTFSSAYADSENLEETLAVAIPKQGRR